MIKFHSQGDHDADGHLAPNALCATVPIVLAATEPTECVLIIHDADAERLVIESVEDLIVCYEVFIMQRD